ncbi:MAG: hypothetical protein WCO08_03150 [Actinomycetes bacterium]
MPRGAESSKLSAKVQQALERARAEQPAQGLLRDGAPESTLEEARADLAREVSRVAHNIFSSRFGPLVGTITQTSIEAGLKNFESSISQAKSDSTLIIHEFSQRIFSSKKDK